MSTDLIRAGYTVRQATESLNDDLTIILSGLWAGRVLSDRERLVQNNAIGRALKQSQLLMKLSQSMLGETTKSGRP